MTTINPQDFDGYDDQANFRGGGQDLRSGSYNVVITRLQRQFVGQKQTPKLGLGIMVLEAFDSDNEDLVGSYHQPSRLGIWADFTKAGNARRLAWLARACGVNKPLDADNDAALVKALTGIPFQLTVEAETSERGGKTYTNLDIVATNDVTAARRKQLLADPAIQTSLGAPGERMEDPYVSGQNRNRGGGFGGGGNGASHGGMPDPNPSSRSYDEDPLLGF